MVEGARLESEYTAKPYRGFESLPLRHHSPAGAVTKKKGARRCRLAPSQPSVVISSRVPAPVAAAEVAAEVPDKLPSPR